MPWGGETACVCTDGKKELCGEEAEFTTPNPTGGIQPAMIQVPLQELVAEVLWQSTEGFIFP